MQESKEPLAEAEADSKVDAIAAVILVISVAVFMTPLGCQSISPVKTARQTMNKKHDLRSPGMAGLWAVVEILSALPEQHQN